MAYTRGNPATGIARGGPRSVATDVPRIVRCDNSRLERQVSPKNRRLLVVGIEFQEDGVDSCSRFSSKSKRSAPDRVEHDLLLIAGARQGIQAKRQLGLHPFLTRRRRWHALANLDFT